MAFQQIELEQERPVIVIVSSRTVVADRVDMPDSCTVLKLEEFDDSQIERWLKKWNESNAEMIASGSVLALEIDAALSQRDLARHPLLLLMLALYSADPQSLPLDSGVSDAVLYQRLISEFARREVLKSVEVSSKSNLADEVESAVHRLSVAALAMFNRGSQSVTELDLTADLNALLDPAAFSKNDLYEPGQRLLGEFFFVYTAEATLLRADSPEILADRAQAIAQKSIRSYEFLHATFGEYLVAFKILEELREIVKLSKAGRRHRIPDDGLLFAIISHQPLAVRYSIVVFFKRLFGALEEVERRNITEAMTTLFQRSRQRVHVERYESYRPLPLDRLRQLAAYSSNLVLLRIAIAGDSEIISIDQLTGGIFGPEHARREWRTFLNLWRAGLEVDGWYAILSLLTLNGDSVKLTAPTVVEVSPTNADYIQAKLEGDKEAEARLGYGLNILQALSRVTAEIQPGTQWKSRT
jgi:hypothetical protein